MAAHPQEQTVAHRHNNGDGAHVTPAATQATPPQAYTKDEWVILLETDKRYQIVDVKMGSKEWKYKLRSEAGKTRGEWVKEHELDMAPPA